MSIADTTFSDSVELENLVKSFQQTHTAIAREVRKVIVGQEGVIEQPPHRSVCRRALPHHRSARNGENFARTHHRPDARAEV